MNDDRLIGFPILLYSILDVSNMITYLQNETLSQLALLSGFKQTVSLENSPKNVKKLLHISNDRFYQNQNQNIFEMETQSKNIINKRVLHATLLLCPQRQLLPYRLGFSWRLSKAMNNSATFTVAPVNFCLPARPFSVLLFFCLCLNGWFLASRCHLVPAYSELCILFPSECAWQCPKAGALFPLLQGDST